MGHLSKFLLQIIIIIIKINIDYNIVFSISVLVSSRDSHMSPGR